MGERAGEAPGRWLTVDEAARYLRMSSRTMERLIDAGRVTVFHMTERRRLIDREELDRIILASRGGA